MIKCKSSEEHIEGSNYLVHIGWESYPADTSDEVWKIINRFDFRTCYTVSSPNGFDTAEFVLY